MKEKKKFSFGSDIVKKLHSSKVDKTAVMRSVLVLFAIALLGALLLSGANELIKVDERNKTDADMVAVMHRILPATEYRKTEVDYKKTEEIEEVYEAYDGTELIGYCVRVQVKDYMDTLTLAVAVDRTNAVSNVEVVKMSENAGTGIKVKDSEFLSSFEGKKSMVTASKGAPKDNSHISVISGATVTSKAVTSGVNEAIAAVSQIEAARAEMGETTTSEETPIVEETPPAAAESTEESEVQAE